ncbi:gamma carbonic anhydrase family protein [Desulfosudis oleivorans]|uniref:Acetyltransferase/acyltransferase n=1 Tax=Desulfosudis oleivorans (strain DSM 6200 / JCM 39069 / Hxd3) TaxID=96561 RepID=A9A003_DESOH|nr:gamma carbonic anhydrase family protein [Desulfosudis oleivorans]ABW67403.1 acetyltransferase/acyltransferase [Desulfosudis oleivorans Hxd3]
MPLYELNKIKPSIGAGTWIAPSAQVIGNVTIGRDCFIGFGAVIRGDFGPIIIGNESLVEDNAVIHTATRTEIGNRVIIGHMAMIHDAIIRDGSLIGMKSMICEGAEIGEGAIVAEQSLVKKGQKIASGKIYAGNPAEFKKEATDHHRKMLDMGIQAYIELTRLYHSTLKPVDP